MSNNPYESTVKESRLPKKPMSRWKWVLVITSVALLLGFGALLVAGLTVSMTRGIPPVQDIGTP